MFAVSPVPPSRLTLAPEHPFVGALAEQIRRVYGERLHSIALFGSVARRTARPDSDVDLLVVVADLPRGRRARLQTFEPVEHALAGAIAELQQHGIHTELSAVLRTPEDLRTASPLMLDLTEDAVILEDRDGVLAAALEDLRKRLRRLGSRRVWEGNTWYWDLKPDYRRGEIIRL
jgi:predicted nucleotidyltransferase